MQGLTSVSIIIMQRKDDEIEDTWQSQSGWVIIGLIKGPLYEENGIHRGL